MPALNINDLNNGKKDLDHIGEIATSEVDTATDRLGRIKLTVRGAINSLKAFNVRGDFVGGALYATKDVYISGGVAYVALIDHVASTVDADLAAGKVSVHQGATREDLIASFGSVLIGFIHSSVGAVRRTVQDKLRDTVNVKDFGAVGDGVTDDTAAVLAAIAALPNGGTVNFGRGTFVLTPFTITTSGISLVGTGVNATTLKLKNAQNSTFILFYGVTGGEAARFTIDGNRANNALGIDKVALQGARCRNVSFHDVHVRDFYGKGLGFDGGPVGQESQDNRMYAFSVTNCKEQAVIVDGSSGTNRRTTISNFSVYDTDHAGVAINDGCEDVSISNGVIDCNNAVWDCVAVRNAKRVSISNVIGKRGRNGLYVQWNLNACEDVVVNGCVFDTNQQNGVLVLSAKRTILSGVTCRNNNQGNVGACAFNVSRGAGTTVESAYTTISGCNAVDDQAAPTQRYGYLFSGAPIASTVSSCNAVGNIDGQYSIANTVASSEITIMSGGNMRLRDTLKWLVTAAAGNLIEFWRDTDTVARFAITQNGQMEWGTGTAVRDVTLGRTGTNILSTNKKFIAVGGLGVGLSAAGISAQAATPAGNTAYKLAIYDSANNLVGYIPIYANPW